MGCPNAGELTKKPTKAGKGHIGKLEETGM
jgi:hypothetical protein